MSGHRYLSPEATNVLEAFRTACYGYEEGVGALANALGMSPGLLYNKANTHDTTHPPTLTDAVLVGRITKNPIIAQALAHTAGGAFLPLPSSPVKSNEDLLKLVTYWMAEQGHFFAEFDKAIADGTISPRESKALAIQAHKVVTACLDLVSRLSTLRPAP